MQHEKCWDNIENLAAAVQRYLLSMYTFRVEAVQIIKNTSRLMADMPSSSLNHLFTLSLSELIWKIWLLPTSSVTLVRSGMKFTADYVKATQDIRSSWNHFTAFPFNIKFHGDNKK